MTTENTITLSFGAKTVQIYLALESAPLVIYHSVMGEGKKLFNECCRLNCPQFSFAVISGVDWNDEMAPWPIPPISKNDTPCTGGADVYLEELTEEILPRIIDALGCKPTYCALAGYSLAGLFALYAAYKTDCFSRLVSASGSVWYPDFINFVSQNDISKNVNAVYLSLGDKESHTKNQYLAPVEDNMRILQKHYSEKGIQTVFCLNQGNHYNNSTRRTAKGILWILQQN